jgi:uncharacterized protein
VRAVAWVKDEPFGVEYAEIDFTPDGLRANGVAIGSDPVPYRIDYTLETTSRFAASLLRVESRGEGWRRALDLRRDDAGTWSASAEAEGDVDLPPPGGDPATFARAREFDLGLSPVTNTLPILRHDLLSGGGPVELEVAWVSVPGLSVQADGQRYAALDRRLIRFEATDGSFAADISVDDDGIVLDYPGIARRIKPR